MVVKTASITLDAVSSTATIATGYSITTTNEGYTPLMWVMYHTHDVHEWVQTVNTMKAGILTINGYYYAQTFSIEITIMSLWRYGT